jgi:hypothetical protein
MATLTEILVSVRELTYDRYPIPVFLLKAKTGKFVTNNSSEFKVLPAPNSNTPDFTYTYSPNENTDKIDNLLTALINGGYPVAFTGYYKPNEIVKNIIKFTNAPLSTNLTFLRRFFLHDEEILDIIIDYYRIVLRMPDEDYNSLLTSVTTLDEYSTKHLVLWVSIQAIEKRRVSEVGVLATSLNFTDGQGLNVGGITPFNPESITVNVGSVFSIQDDNTMTAQYFSEDFNRVGSDNVLGDKNSFWFKIFLWLRKKLESEYQDFYFRDDNVIFGNIRLTKDSNYLSYFDSYPYTFSPLSRNIIT